MHAGGELPGSHAQAIRGVDKTSYQTDLTGAQKLELIVEPAEDGNHNDWGLWLNWTLIPRYTEARGPLHNFFQPSMKLVAKWRAGSRWACRRALQS
jgi:hypothetical protein